MSRADQTRPVYRCVWVSEEELNEPAEWVRNLVWVRFNAAPESATEAACRALSNEWNEPLAARSDRRRDPQSFWWEANIVLRALGQPEATP